MVTPREQEGNACPALELNIDSKHERPIKNGVEMA